MFIQQGRGNNFKGLGFDRGRGCERDTNHHESSNQPNFNRITMVDNVVVHIVLTMIATIVANWVTMQETVNCRMKQKRIQIS